MEDTWVREVEDGPTTTRVRIVPSFVLRTCLDKVKYNGNTLLSCERGRLKNKTKILWYGVARGLKHKNTVYSKK